MRTLPSARKAFIAKIDQIQSLFCLARSDGLQMEGRPIADWFAASEANSTADLPIPLHMQANAGNSLASRHAQQKSEAAATAAANSHLDHQAQPVKSPAPADDIPDASPQAAATHLVLTSPEIPAATSSGQSSGNSHGESRRLLKQVSFAELPVNLRKITKADSVWQTLADAMMPPASILASADATGSLEPGSLAVLIGQSSRMERRLLEAQLGVPKVTILYFAGDTREQDMTYSHGVRQTIRAMFHDKPGIVADPFAQHLCSRPFDAIAERL